MITLTLRDSLHSLRLWLASIVVFLAVGFSAALLAFVYVAITAGQHAGMFTGDTVEGAWSVWGTHVGLTVFVGLVAISGALRQIFDERSELLARLALAGASPVQCTAMLNVQAAIVAAFGTIVGSFAAWWATGPVCRWFTSQLRLNGTPVPYYSTHALWSAVICVLGVAMLASTRRAWLQLKLTPVQQVQLWRNPKPRRIRWFRALCVVLIGTGLIAMVWTTVSATRSGRMQMSPDYFLSGAMGVSMWAACAIITAAPWITIGLLRLAAHCVPEGSVIWLALRALIDRPDSTLSAINPMALSIALPFGVLAPAWTFAEALISKNGAAGTVNADGASLLTICALPLLIAVSTSLMSLAISARRQRASMRTISLAGATPFQQIHVQIAHALIVVCVAVLEAAVAVGVGVGWCAEMMTPMFGRSVPVFPLRDIVISGCLLLVVCVICELVCVLPACRRLPAVER